MPESLARAAKWLLGPEAPRAGRSGHLWARWIFLRALALIYFSAFYSFLFQVRGLLGPSGLLPVADYLRAVDAAFHSTRFWFAPSLLWFGSSDRALLLLCWIGLAASLLVFFNVWPRVTLAISFVCFLSLISVAQDFAGYQSDGMLLEAGFVALFFAPPGWRPGLARAHPASRAALYLLRWEWFRIYFESGTSKMMSGDVSWRNFTAMDEYYQNGPLPTWIGWYAQHLPHWFHAGTVGLTLAVELLLVWMVFLPRRFRVICFWIVTPFETAIILTANYAFLNYIVLCLGFLLLDDRFIESVLPARFRGFVEGKSSALLSETERPAWRKRLRLFSMWPFSAPPSSSPPSSASPFLMSPLSMSIAGLCFLLVGYVTTAKLLEELFPSLSLPQQPVRLIEPFRIAQDYHLFGTMTPNRLEIEFQGTADGKNWTPYKFRYKPQDLDKAPGIYAPYQPRFEWNLWFASLDSWQQNRFVLWTEERLLKNDPDVLELFAANPFPGAPPLRVRSVLYQYWFTDLRTRRTTGLWWRRELLGDYAPQLERRADGTVELLGPPISQADAP